MREKEKNAFACRDKSLHVLDSEEHTFTRTSAQPNAFYHLAIFYGFRIIFMHINKKNWKKKRGKYQKYKHSMKEMKILPDEFRFIY